MIILGIDPGLAIVGWGVVEYENAKFRVLGYGSITTPAGMSTPERLSRIDLGLKEIIDKYSVYSMETAHEMALNISKEANSDIGIGITGKLNRAGVNNNYGKDNQVFVSIYYKDNYYDMVINVDKKSRKQNKIVIIDKIIVKLGELLWGEGLIK